MNASATLAAPPGGDPIRRTSAEAARRRCSNGIPGALRARVHDFGYTAVSLLAMRHSSAHGPFYPKDAFPLLPLGVAAVDVAAFELGGQRVSRRRPFEAVPGGVAQRRAAYVLP
jgi:hypothetical protein